MVNSNIQCNGGFGMARIVAYLLAGNARPGYTMPYTPKNTHPQHMLTLVPTAPPASGTAARTLPMPC